MLFCKDHKIIDVRKDLIVIIGVGVPVVIFMILIGGGGHTSLDFEIEDEKTTIEESKQIQPSSSQPTSTQSTNCDSSYPDVCIPTYPPDLDCGEISFSNFRVLQPDQHGFDRDKDGIGCEK